MRKNVSSSSPTAIIILSLFQVSLYLFGCIFSFTFGVKEYDFGYHNLIFLEKLFTLASFYDDLLQLPGNRPDLL